MLHSQHFNRPLISSSRIVTTLLRPNDSVCFANIENLKEFLTNGKSWHINFVKKNETHVTSLFQNFFGVIRGHNGHNEHPSASIFRGTLRLTAACQMLKMTAHGNCTNIDENNLMSIVDALREWIHSIPYFLFKLVLLSLN